MRANPYPSSTLRMGKASEAMIWRMRSSWNGKSSVVALTKRPFYSPASSLARNTASLAACCMETPPLLTEVSWGHIPCRGICSICPWVWPYTQSKP